MAAADLRQAELQAQGAVFTQLFEVSEGWSGSAWGLIRNSSGMRSCVASLLFYSSVILVAIGYSPAGSGASSEALTFQAWKASRIEEASSTIERLEMEAALDRLPPVERSPGEKMAVIKVVSGAAAASVAPPAVRTAARALRPEQRLGQAKINYEIAKELTIQDYIAVYLSQYTSRASMVDIAKKLSAEEVAELLLALRGANSQGPAAATDLSSSGVLPKR